MNRALPASFAILALAVAVGCPPEERPCPVSQVKCGDRCVDPLSDPSSCGGCGNVCAAGTTCCGGACADTLTSADHCGGCGRSCGTGSCAAGACVCPNGPAEHCAADPWPWCRDLSRDAAHCGDCATACGQLAFEACSGGACGCFDPGHATTCAAQGTCTDLAVDPQNCGTCGLSCTSPGKTRCAGGACACSSAALTDCTPSGVEGCFDLKTSAAHCGACGVACRAGEACCAGACRAVASDASNCGACGNACPDGRTCTSGACVCAGVASRECGASCCTGTACCAGDTCQTEHSNGLGGKFLDCSAPYSATSRWTEAAATAAALSWSASGTAYPGLCDAQCIARQTTSQCAVWCWGSSPNAGRVALRSADINCTAACSAFIGPTAGTTVATWQ